MKLSWILYLVSCPLPVNSKPHIVSPCVKPQATCHHPASQNVIELYRTICLHPAPHRFPVSNHKPLATTQPHDVIEIYYILCLYTASPTSSPCVSNHKNVSPPCITERDRVLPYHLSAPNKLHIVSLCQTTSHVPPLSHIT